MRSEQRSIFVEVFGYDTCIGKCSNIFIWWFLWVVIVIKTQFRVTCILMLHNTRSWKHQLLQNSTKIQSNIYIYIYISFFKPVSNVCYFNYMLLNQIHTHCFNISVICRELRLFGKYKVIVFWHDVVISSQ